MGLLSKLFGGSKTTTVEYELKPAGTLIDKDGWYYREYQDDDDSPYTIRFEQDKPGDWEQIVDWCQVAGINVPERGQNVMNFFFGSYRWLGLEREPDNQYDPNAIKVIGYSKNQKGRDQAAQIGYVPRETAQTLADADVSKLWPAIRFIRFPEPGPDPFYSMRFDIYQRK